MYVDAGCTYLASRRANLVVSRQALGEMATAIPVSGSFTEYAQRFVDDALAFGLGWAYWYLWVTVCRCLILTFF